MKFLGFPFLACISLTSFIALSGCAHDKLINTSVDGVYKVSPTVYRGGRPSPKRLAGIKDLGIRTVLSLEEDPKKVERVRREAHEAKLQFMNLPISLYRRPNDAEALAFLRYVLDPVKAPVYVHCNRGKDRTGAMIALYRIVAQGWQPKEGYNEAKEYGFWPYRGDAELKKFILQLNDFKHHYRAVNKIKINSQ